MKMMVGASLKARLKIAETILFDSPNLQMCVSQIPEEGGIPDGVPEGAEGESESGLGLAGVRTGARKTQ